MLFINFIHYVFSLLCQCIFYHTSKYQYWMYVKHLGNIHYSVFTCLNTVIPFLPRHKSTWTTITWSIGGKHGPRTIEPMTNGSHERRELHSQALGEILPLCRPHRKGLKRFHVVPANHALSIVSELCWLLVSEPLKCSGLLLTAGRICLMIWRLKLSSSCLTMRLVKVTSWVQSHQWFSQWCWHNGSL